MSRVAIMTDDRKAGIALIAGSLGGILTMAVHPSGMASETADQVAHLSLVSGAAHSLGLVSVLLLFLGACGLARCIVAPDRISFTAAVTYGFGCVAIMIAAAVSGFTVPGLMKDMVGDVAAAGHQWRIVIDGIFQINQAFARVYCVAASIAIILWSVSTLRNGGLGRGVAIYGCVVSPLIIVAIAIGHLRLNVHGMGVVMLGQAAWFIVAGSQLCSRLRSGGSAQ
jgi:hypothetical protein